MNKNSKEFRIPPEVHHAMAEFLAGLDEPDDDQRVAMALTDTKGRAWLVTIHPPAVCKRLADSYDRRLAEEASP